MGEERKEENAEVSNSNKSSNAEQFLPVLSSSVDPISNPKTGLCLVALAVGRPVQSKDHLLPLPPSPSPKVQFVQAVPPPVSSSAGLLEDTSQQHRGL